MKSTAQKLIFISFVLALIASVTASLYLQSLKSSNKTAKNITVLVAAETIPSRTLIDKKMIKEIKVPDNFIFTDYIKDYSKIVGKYTKETISKNEGFSTDKLLDKNGNELSVKIDSNYRAISVSVTGDSGISDLVKPGDYVDVITYFTEKKDGTTVVRPDVAKIILQNIQVLAVDKQINRDDKASTNTNENDKGITNFLVTLSVKTSDLEKLVLSESIGSIKLALRPLKDSNTTETNGTTWDKMSISVSSNNGITSNGGGNSGSTSNGNVNYKNYTVQTQDTLKKISMEFYGDENKYTIIKEANNIRNENLIFIGEVIKIPILQK